MTRLDELDKDEWRDVTRKLRPDWDDARFNAAWRAFVEVKRKRALQ